MDRKRGTYHTLNEVSGRIWELLGGGSTVAVLTERLLDEYDVPRLQLEADVVATVQQFLRDQLIASEGTLSASPVKRKPKPARRSIANNRELRAPSVLWCGIMIFVVKAMLKTRGFAWTMDWVRRQVDGMPSRWSVDVDLVRRVEYGVAMAGALYPGRALCLEQSLVLYHVLRRQGVPVNFRMGVQPHPLVAHAWVDYRGEPLNDIAEHVKWFAEFQEHPQ